MATDWQMPPTKGACAAGDRVFEPGEPFRAYLFAVAEGYERRDYCLTCTPPDEGAALASWKARRPQPSAPRTAAMDLDAVYGMFESLHDAEAPQQKQLRFVLALLLWRRRVLKLTDTRQDGEREMWQFAAPSRDAAHLVERPPLSEHEIDQLGTQLEALISGQAPPGASAADNPAVPTGQGVLYE